MLRKEDPSLCSRAGYMSIEEMHQQRMNHTMIAAKLGIHRQTVSRTLQHGECKPVYGPRPAHPSAVTCSSGSKPTPSSPPYDCWTRSTSGDTGAPSPS